MERTGLRLASGVRIAGTPDLQLLLREPAGCAGSSVTDNFTFTPDHAIAEESSFAASVALRKGSAKTADGEWLGKRCPLAQSGEASPLPHREEQSRFCGENYRRFESCCYVIGTE